MRPRLVRHVALAALIALALVPSGCTDNCANYALGIVVEDQATGNLLCNAKITFFLGDAGIAIDGGFPVLDAEVAASSSACVWGVIVDGGNYVVSASAPGFATGSTTLMLPTDQCGDTNVQVTVYLARS
jgi:hypothetical protein